MNAFSLPPEIRQLSVEDRLALAEQIWDSIAEDITEMPLDEDAFLTDEIKAELDRRLACIEKNGPQMTEWSIVKRRLLGEP